MNRLLTIVDSKYQRLEYLESTGTQYIDTGISKETNIVCELTLQSKDTSGNKIILGAESTGGQWFGTSGTVYGLGGNSNFTIDSTTKQKVTINIKYHTSISATINDITKTRTVASTGAYLYPTYRLFGLRGDGNEFVSSCKIFSGIIQDENGNVLRKYVPVLRKTDNELGMLDLVEGKFYPNAGTGKFTANLDTMYAIIQGSPTINNGFVSNFSGSNYLKLPKIDFSGEWEILLNFKTSDAANTSLEYIFGSEASNRGILLDYNNGVLKLWLSGNGTSWNILSNQGTYQIQANTEYYVRLSYKNSTYKFEVSTDKINWVDGATITSTTPIYNDAVHYIGSCWDRNTSAMKPNGNFNLNQSYIKIGATKYKLQAVVGYTKVGSPTITDGVVSGFSSANYLTLPTVQAKDITEFVVKFKINSGATANAQIPIFNSAAIRVQSTTTASTAGFYYTQFLIAGFGFVQAESYLAFNSWHWIKYTNDGTTMRAFYSSDGINWTEGQNKSSVGMSTTGNFEIGKSNFETGEIDFNETYIKTNNKLWFNGQQAA